MAKSVTIDAKTGIAIIGVVGTLLSIMTAGEKIWGDIKKRAISEELLHREVHQLRQIIVEQYPAYTASFNWADDGDK